MATTTRKPNKFLSSGLVQYVTVHHDSYPLIDSAQADLSGKSVLITGASKGIGKATAISFATAGCSRIALAARSGLGEVEQAVKKAAAGANRPEPQVLQLRVDVSSEESVAAAAKEVNQAFGGSLDVLINNAGYLDAWKPIGESDPAEWWKSWEVNLKGTYLCTRYFIPLVLKSETKTVINVSSAGAHNTTPGASAYQVAKFACCRFTEFLDQEYYEQGMTAISVHPGGVPTDLALNMPSGRHDLLLDTPELAADTFVWLAKDKREWLAGRFISVGWDLGELEKKKPDILERDLLKFRMAF